MSDVPVPRALAAMTACLVGIADTVHSADFEVWVDCMDPVVLKLPGFADFEVVVGCTDPVALGLPGFADFEVMVGCTDPVALGFPGFADFGLYPWIRFQENPSLVLQDLE